MSRTESHFTEITYFNIPNYQVYSTNHPSGNAHGGTAILIKNSIPHHECPSFNSYKIQATNIKIDILPLSITLSAVYCPPRHPISAYEFETFFSTLGPRFLPGGDWNAKHTFWGSRLTTTKGRNLYKATRSNQFTYLSTGEPTYWPSDERKRPDLLDFFIAKHTYSNYTQVETNYELSSDHSPVILTLSTTIINKHTNISLTSHRTDWEGFRLFLEEKIKLDTKLKTPDDIDEAVNNFTQLIQHAAQGATPTICEKKKTCYNIPKKVADLISGKRRIRRIWQQTRNRNQKRILNNLTRELQKLLKKRNNEIIEDYLINLNTKDNSLWKPTKKLKRPQQRVPPIRKPDDTWAKKDSEKSDLFADHLIEVFKPFPADADSVRHEEEIIKFLDVPCPLSLPTKPITPADIYFTLKGSKMRKAPGFYLITEKILRELPDKAIIYLTHIFNAMLRLSYWPLTWKYAEIIMLQKPGKPVDDVRSYRGISLLPTLSKIFEKLILKRFLSEESIQNVLPNHQFGFRNLHSTIQQVHRVVNTIGQTLEEKSFCSAAFLDQQSAFDKVWHTGLLYKLKKLLPQQLYLLLKSYLEDRFFRVKFNGTLSKYGQINASVPQGSVLGPFLYTLYTHDLPLSNNTITATFADDTAILAKHKNATVASDALQNHLDSLQLWLKKWRIKVNESKSVHVTFTLKKSLCPPVALNNTLIPRDTKVRYLGIHLDQKLTWKHHIQMKKTQLDLKYKKMFWLLGPNSKLSIENKLLLYKMILKPVWTYGIELWGCAKPSNINIIQRFQSKTLRKMLGAPYYVSNKTIHEDLKIPFVREEIKDRPKNYRKRIPNHLNELIRELEKPITTNKRLKKTYPTDLFILEV
ncbi:hypothetical protein WDU94_012177 [Cyamophila willieti]